MLGPSAISSRFFLTLRTGSALLKTAGNCQSFELNLRFGPSLPAVFLLKSIYALQSKRTSQSWLSKWPTIRLYNDAERKLATAATEKQERPAHIRQSRLNKDLTLITVLQVHFDQDPFLMKPHAAASMGLCFSSEHFVMDGNGHSFRV